MRPADLALWFALGCGALLLLHGERPPYDDAFFFVRVGRNTALHLVPAWNLADGPVFGNTSQVQQALATLAWVLRPDHVIACLRATSAASLVAAAWALGGLRQREGIVPPAEALAIVLALTGPVAMGMLHSGMETALSVGLGAGFLWLRPRSPSLAAGIAVLLVATRPDAGLLVGGTLLADAWTQRRWRPLAGFAVGLLGFAAATTAVYGTPLPTSFAAKAGGSPLYDATFLERCRSAKLEHVALWLACTVPLAGRWRSARWAVWGPAVAFVLWHALITVDVMGMHARFFAPALPWVLAGGHGRPSRPVTAAWALGFAGAWASGWLPDMSGWSLGVVGDGSYAVLLLGGLVWTVLPDEPRAHVVAPVVALLAWLAWLLTSPVKGGAPPADAQLVSALSGEVTSFRGLQRVVSCLGSGSTVFHSEIGVPGMRLPEGMVVDLGGLMRPDLTPEDLDPLCVELEPDAIFLPHRNYATARQALLEGPCLTGYRRVVARGSSPLYVRADHMATWRACTAR